MLTAQNSHNVLIGKNIARTASVQVTDASATSTYIADGEIVVLDETGAVLTPGNDFTDTKWIKVIQRSGDKIVQSGKISGANVTAFKGTDGTAVVQQVTHVGFDGSTAGTLIDVTQLNRQLKVTYTMDYSLGSEQLKTRIYPADFTATPTQDAVAEKIARGVNADPWTKVKAEILVDHAGGGDLSGSTGTVAVFNGSAVVVAATAGTPWTTAGYAVGDYIRIPIGSATGAVYKISAISGVNLTLTMPWQGASAAAVASNERITLAQAQAAACGVQLTGLALQFSTAYFAHMVTSFIVGTPVSDWEDTTVTYTTKPSYGVGTYEQAAMAEWESLGYEGALNRSVVPLPTGRTDATSGTQYDVITINYFDASDSNVISGTKPSPAQLTLFIVDGASQATDVLAQLNPWMNSLPLAFDSITL